MFKFIFYYGNLDDFDRGPKRLKIGFKTENIAKYLVIDEFGAEYIVGRPRMPFYDIIWSFTWKQREESL